MECIIQETKYTISTVQESYLKFKTNNDSIIHPFWEHYEVRKLSADLESWRSEVLRCTLTFNPSVCISRHGIWACGEITNGLNDCVLISHL